MAILKSVFVVATADQEGTDSSPRRHGFDFWVNYFEIVVTPSGHCRVLEGVYCTSVGLKFKWLGGLTALKLP